MDWIGFAAVIGATGTIILGIIVPVLNSLSSRKDKKLEHMFSIQKKEVDQRCAIEEKRIRELENKTNSIMLHLYSYLYPILTNLQADRVTIVQPHPYTNQQYISVSHEIVNLKRGVSSERSNFQFRSITEWKDVVEIWKKNEFLVFKDINEMKNFRKLFAEAYRRGCGAAIYFRLHDDNSHWIGTLAIDFIDAYPTLDMEEFQNKIRTYGNLIADILTAYDPPDEFKK